MIPGLTIEEEVLELESQIRHLNAKVAAAVDRAADLEDEIRKYKQRERAQAASAASATGGEESGMEPASALKRMSTFMFSNKRASNALSEASAATPTSPRKNAADDHLPLAIQLAKERQARQQAEENYAQLQQESEELSQTLFEEANKMVAQERKLTHQVTEKLKVLADREEERTARLRHLEGAMERILRVRGLLAASPATARSSAASASASATTRSPVATPVKSPATVVAAAQAQHAARYAERAQPRSPGSSKPTSPAAALASGAAQLPVFSPSKITLAREAARIQIAANAQRISPPPAGAAVAPQNDQTTVAVPRIKTNTSMQQAREAATASAAQAEQQQRREQLAAARASPPAKIKLQPRPAATWTQSPRPSRPTSGTAGALTPNGVERRPIVRRPVAEVGEASA